jgi:DNA-binding CsgD family transcriptional regulator
MNERPYRGPERRTAQRSGDTRLLAAALDEVDHGLMVVRSDLSIVFANHVARKVLADGVALRLYGEFLLPGAESDRARLLVALQAAREKHVRSLLRLGEGEAGQELSVAPLQDNMHSLGGPGACLVKLGRTEGVSEVSVMAFAKLHGLSQREREVLAALCRGQRPAEIALVLGLSLATVRTHVHNLRRKAAVSDVLALVQKVAAVPSMERALKGPAGKPS